MANGSAMQRTTALEHESATRVNNPPIEADRTQGERIGEIEKAAKAADHRKDRRERSAKEPYLRWERDRERKTAEAPALMRVEQLEPERWLEALRRRYQRRTGEPEQGEIGTIRSRFNAYDDPEKAKWNWYRHEGPWSNRLIHGDSRRVMASLLAHENMAGAVQMVYFDPPYGMDFDAKLTQDPLHRAAFVDSYEQGIHSYLDGIRETAELARELLHESGSIFMQIGDVNVHRVALVLDEVFGAENRMAMITFATGGGGSSTTTISKSADFLLWYAKNRDEAQYHELYKAQNMEEWIDGQSFAGGGADLPSGEIRALKAPERRDPKAHLPEGTRLWAMDVLVSQGASEGEQGQPFVHDGVQYGPKGLSHQHWKVDRKGLEALAKAGRLWSNVPEGQTKATATQLRLKKYRDEMPGARLNTVWATPQNTRNKVYPVQTAESVIGRCMLMTTKPGDLVLDPSSGSGTTAVTAEEWARRWIVADSSREAIAAARERILINRYTRHHLINSDLGFKLENDERRAAGMPELRRRPGTNIDDPAGGIVVRRMPYVTAATLAYKGRTDKQPKREWTTLVNQPVKAKKDGRVASMFTVETERVSDYASTDELLAPREAKRYETWQEQAIGELEAEGIACPDNATTLHAECMEPVAAGDGAGRTRGRITHRCKLHGRNNGKRQNAVVAVWPRDQQVGADQISENVSAVLDGKHAAFASDYEQGNPPVLVVLAADFHPSLPQRDDQNPWGSVEVVKGKTNPKVHLSGTKRQRKGGAELVMVAEPSMRIEPCEETDRDGAPMCRAILEGWHWYDPLTGKHDFAEVGCGEHAKQVTMWMLDTSYDGRQFVTERIHVGGHPRGDGDWTQSVKSLRKLLEHLPAEISQIEGFTSEPFPYPKTGQVGLRVILGDGNVLMHREPVRKNGI